KLQARFPRKSGIHFANGFAMSSSDFFFPESKQQQRILAELRMYYACAKRGRRDRSSRLSLQQLLAFWTKIQFALDSNFKGSNVRRSVAQTFNVISFLRSSPVCRNL